MRADFILYVNGYEVDLMEDFQLNMTYTVEKSTNPTAIKNNYSKTITLPGTNKNNQVFNNLWNTTSIYNEYFDLIKKSDFKLFYNGELYEEGYIKVDNVIKNGHNIEYKCTLYGGLGDFFYCLSVDDEGNKMRLSDLNYGGGDYEFDLLVNKDVIYNAWTSLINGTTEGTIYDDINFAVCQNGIPENFSSNKVLINRREQGPYYFPLNFAQDGVTYRSLNGWILGELKEEYDEWASRDLRSYLQRPVFRVKTFFRGICNPENNGGYTVNLDSTFFNENNPYYEKAWITLPLISEMDEVIEGQQKQTGITIDLGNHNIAFNRNTLEYKSIVPTITTEDKPQYINLPFQLTTTVVRNCERVMTGCKYTLNRENMYYNAPIAVQLVGKKKGTETIEYRSDVEVFTSFNDLDSNEYEVNTIGGIQNINVGYFCKSGDTSTYVWGTKNGDENVYETKNLIIRNIDDFDKYDWSILITRYEYYSKGFSSWNPDTHYLNCVFIGAGSNELGNMYSGEVPDFINNYFPYKAYSTSFKLDGEVEEAETFTEVNKRKLTKQRMLGKDGTPLQYLLGYTKQFGLYFLKDLNQKVIHIMTRKTFYGKRNVIDLDDLIDRGETITITPLNFERKWYDMGLKLEENKYSEKYDKFSDIPFGVKRVDTGYEYVKETEEFLKDNIYKGGVMVREKSPYLVNFRLPK